jgi:hypothetical protein
MSDHDCFVMMCHDRLERAEAMAKELCAEAAALRAALEFYAEYVAAVEALFADWVRGEIAQVWEYSGSITADVIKVLDAARERAVTLGIGFDESLVPDYVLGEDGAEDA